MTCWCEDPPFSNYEMVKEFHEIYSVPIATAPQLLDKERQDLRISLIDEEFTEYKEAIEAGDIIEAADALADLLYVVYGACLEHGFDADALVQEVHRSNKTKLDSEGKPILNEYGKVMKGPDFELPKIAEVLGLVSR